MAERSGSLDRSCCHLFMSLVSGPRAPGEQRRWERLFVYLAFALFGFWVDIAVAGIRAVTFY